MLNLKNKWMIGVLVSLISIFYIDALVTGPLESTQKNDNITIKEANI